MYVFIDTNVFYNNWHVSNADFKLLFNLIESTNSKLLISDLVQLEIENLRNERIEEIIINLDNEIRRAKKVLGKKLEFDFSSIKEPYNFKDILLSKISLVEFIPYNSVPQNTTVCRAIRKIRPFQDEDKGYRDTLIWLSLLNYLNEKRIKKEVIFITNNKDDFFSKGELEFHEILKKDIADHSLQCTITPYDSLHRFLKERAAELREEYTEDKLIEGYLYDAENQLEDGVLTILNDLTISELRDILGKSHNQLPHLGEMLSFEFEIIEGAEDLKIVNFSRLSADSIYMISKFNLRRCAINFVLPIELYWRHKETFDAKYYDIEERTDVVTLYAFIRPDFEVSFDYSIAEETISDLTLINIGFL